MDSKNMIFPEEIERFFVSKGYFKDVLQTRLGAGIKSLVLDDGKAKIGISSSLLEEMTADNYNRDVDSVNFYDDGVELVLKNSGKPNFEEFGSGFDAECETKTSKAEQNVNYRKDNPEKFEEKTLKGNEIKKTKNVEDFSEKERKKEKETFEEGSVDSGTVPKKSAFHDKIAKLEKLRESIRKED